MIHNESVIVTDRAFLNPQTQEQTPQMVAEIHPSADFPATPLERRGARRIAIVGGGCTGLRLALLFKKWNEKRPPSDRVETVVFETAPHAGGFLQSHKNSLGQLVESGAQGVLASRPVFLETLEDLGLTPVDVLSAPRSGAQAARFLITPSGELKRLSPLTVLGHGLTHPSDFIRLFLEFFGRRPHRPPHPDETLFQFVSRRMGRSWAENFVLPFATGIWGGGSEKLLIRHTFPKLQEIELRNGSLLRTAVLGLILRLFKNRSSAPQRKHDWPKGLLSFPGGMHTFTEKMLQSVSTTYTLQSIRFNSPVHSLRRTEHGTCLVNGNEEFDFVFWTSAPWFTPQLNFENPEMKKEWDFLQSTPTHNLIVVNVSGLRSQVTRDGFGALAPRASDGLLGVLFVHSIYPKHTAPNTYSYRVLLGGDRNPDMISWSDDKLLEYTYHQLKRLGLVDSSIADCEFNIVRWNRAIGIADALHDERLNALWRLQAHMPQLRFAGIYKKGVGVADALQSAQEAFDDWLSELRPTQ